MNKQCSRMLKIAVTTLILLSAGRPGLAQYYHVTGHVTDPTGGAIWNVDLDIEDANTGEPLNISGDHTDPSGFYDIILPIGTYNIEFNAPPGVKLVSEMHFNVAVQADIVLNIILEEGYYLSGRVTDSQGSGVADVDTDVDDPETGLRIVTPRDNTDGNGDYLDVVPAGVFDVTFEPPPGMRLVGTVVHGVEVSGDTRLDVSLEDGYFVSGWVVNEAGSALSDIDIDVNHVGTGDLVITPRDNTDTDGYYLVVVPSGLFSFTFDPLKRDDLAASRFDSVAISSDTVLDTVTLLAGVKLSGTVTDTRQTPVAGANLDVIDVSTMKTLPTPHDAADDTGHYEVTVPPGFYDLRMKPPTGSDLASKLISSVTVSNDTTVDFILEDATGIEGDAENGEARIPRGITLSQNHPNPFNPLTTIQFVIPDPQQNTELGGGTAPPVLLEVFDLRGRRIKVLIDEILDPGSHSVVWDGKDGQGNRVSSGMYFYRLRYGDFSSLRKMTVLK